MSDTSVELTDQQKTEAIEQMKITQQGEVRQLQAIFADLQIRALASQLQDGGRQTIGICIPHDYFEKLKKLLVKIQVMESVKGESNSGK